jgi:hypothetical protein
MVTNYFLFNGVNYAYSLNGETLFVDAKPILKAVFSSAANYIVELGKNPSVNNEGGRGHLWVPINVLLDFFADKHNAARVESGANFDLFDLKENLFDFLFENGNKSFVSERRKAAEIAEKNRIAKENELLLAKLQAENERLKAADQARIADEKERARAGVNPVIRALNDVWFPVLMSGVFATVIGGFSYQILSDTMEMNVWLNVLLAIAYVLFPILTAIRQYTFDFGDVKIQPLWVVMVIDMVFTAYHVGWLRGEEFETTVKMASLHPMLKMVYILIIPLMQKGTNEMILKIRATYLVKGWLPKVD